jgi:hypothetical protein
MTRFRNQHRKFLKVSVVVFAWDKRWKATPRDAYTKVASWISAQKPYMRLRLPAFYEDNVSWRQNEGYFTLRSYAVPKAITVACLKSFERGVIRVQQERL